ncbi:phosphoribulokinase [Marmoricola sp. URHA0025 HA25]
MAAKLVRMRRLEDPPARRPVVLAIAGDSASGKTTLARGLVAALGPERCTSICVDDYHRYDRGERRSRAITPLDPRSNHIDIMEQQLQLVALGRPILKPVYDHTSGQLVRPEYVASREFLIVEGLLPLSTRLARACFDIAVYLDPEESLRREWKVARDVLQRGYTEREVLEELQRREADAAAYIAPQRRFADIVVRFSANDGPATDRDAGVALSAELLLRPTIRHPALSTVLSEDHRSAVHLKIVRDDGTPTDLLHVHGTASPEETTRIEKLIWSALQQPGEVPADLGQTRGARSEPLAITQLILLHHLLQGAAEATA